MKHTSRLLLAAATLVAASSAHAADYQFDTNGTAAGYGANGTFTWNLTNTYWDAIPAGANNGTDATVAYTFTDSDKAIFGGDATGTLAATLAQNVTLNALDLSNTAASGSGTIFRNIAGPFTLTLAGATPTLTVTNGPTRSTAAIITANLGGTGFTKQGNGELRINADNAATLSGTVHHAAGTIRVNTDTAFGTATIDFNNTAGASLTSYDNITTRVLNNALTFTGTTGAVTLGGGSYKGITFTNTVNLGGDARTLSIAQDSAFNGVVSNGGITKGGLGNLTLAAANTYTGGTTVNAGTLTVADTGSINVGAAGVTVSATGTLVVNGALELTANNATIANSGAINFAASGASIFGGSLFDTGLSGNTYQLLTNSGAGVISNADAVFIDLTGSSAWSSASLDNTGLITFTAVPEPSTYGLMGAGALAAVAMVRRRRKHAGLAKVA